MKERPILFNGDMVLAIIDGRNTQTRRKIKPIKHPYGHMLTPDEVANEIIHETGAISSPYGKVGDRLWVRETFYPVYPQDPNYNDGEPIEYDYKATYNFGRMSDALGIKKQWRRSIHMPRRASRILLEITGGRVERLNDVSEEDAVAEGMFFTDYGRKCYHQGPVCDVGDCPAPDHTHPQRPGWSYKNTTHQDQCLPSAKWAFANLWKKINGIGSWDLNPWVWVIEFKVLEIKR